MITKELTEYIQGLLDKGASRDAITSKLLESGGWTQEDISEAFDTIDGKIPLEEEVVLEVEEEKVPEDDIQESPIESNSTQETDEVEEESLIPEEEVLSESQANEPLSEISSEQDDSKVQQENEPLVDNVTAEEEVVIDTEAEDEETQKEAVATPEESAEPSEDIISNDTSTEGLEPTSDDSTQEGGQKGWPKEGEIVDESPEVVESKGKSVIVIAIIVILLLSAGAVSAYFMFIGKGSGTPEAMTPSEILIASSEAMSSVSSVRTKVTLDYSGTALLKTSDDEFAEELEMVPPDGVLDDVQIDGTSTADIAIADFQEASFDLQLMLENVSDQDNLWSEGSASISLSADGGNSGAMSVDGVIDYKAVTDVLYVRVRDLSLSELPFNTKIFENIWVRIPYKELVQQRQGIVAGTEEAGDPIDNEMTSAQKVLVERLTDVSTSILVMDEVKTLIDRSAQPHEGVVIDGKDMHSFTLRFTQADWEYLLDGVLEGVTLLFANAEFQDELIAASGDESVRMELVKLENDLAEFKAEYGKFKTTEDYQQLLRLLADIEFTFTVGVDDLYLYQVEVKTSVSDEYLPDGVVSFDVTFEESFSDFNKPVVIEEPTSYKTIEEIVSLFFSQMFGGGTLDVEPVGELEIMEI